MSEWTIEYTNFAPWLETLNEVHGSTGNGYFCNRTAIPWEPSKIDIHYPATYLAGGYNRVSSQVGDRMLENEDLVNWPNWQHIRFKFDDGDWFSLHDPDIEILDFKRTYNLKNATNHFDVRVKDSAGNITRIHSDSFAHMKNANFGALGLEIEPENWVGNMTVESGIDGNVFNDNVARYRELESRHIAVTNSGRDPKTGALWLDCESSQAKQRVVEGVRTRFFLNGKAVEVSKENKPVQRDAGIFETFNIDVKPGETTRIEKVASIHNSRDRAVSEPFIACMNDLATVSNIAEMKKSHDLAWNQLWRRCDVEILSKKKDNASVNAMLRWHVSQMLQAMSPNTADLDVGVPARAWNGEAYRGHVFWDEMYILPYFFLRAPDIAKGHLMYRARRLDIARNAAKNAGFDGALFPWQSSSDGREETQQFHLNTMSGKWAPDNSSLQRHSNLAIAYDFWKFYETTGDEAFLRDHGAEVLLEIARMCASLTSYNPDMDKYEIKGVMGPDEFHDAYPGAKEPGLDNNFYTNVMAAWCMRTAMKGLDTIDKQRQAELREQMELTDEELENWREIAGKMHLEFHKDGIPSQFEGYEALKDLDWEHYREKYDGNIGRMDRILKTEGDHANNYKVSKQADVLMLFYLFPAEELRGMIQEMGYDLPKDMIPKTIDYYRQRTSNGSTLSNLVSSWVLAREDRKHSYKLFRDALDSDFLDVQGGTTKEGVHLGAMAGTVDLVQRCWSGMEFKDGVVHFDPCLPEEIDGVRFNATVAGNAFTVEILQGNIKITSLYGPADLKVACNGQVKTLAEEEVVAFSLNKNNPRQVQRKKVQNNNLKFM